MKLNFRSDQPIYLQLKQYLSESIVTAVYGPGQRLPSVRDIALDAEVNPNTVQRALAELERDGLVFSARTTGRFVTLDEALIRQTRLNMATEHARVFWKAMQKLCVSQEEARMLLDNIKEERV